MIVFIQIALLLTLLLIVFQDFKSKAVWWFLFPMFAILGGYLFKSETSWVHYIQQIAINLGLIIVLIGLLYLYSRLRLKRQLINSAIGLGDLLFFAAFALSFPTLSFLNFFVFSLFFSLIISLLLRSKFGMHSIPLAGAMALFLIGVYLSNWLGWSPGLFQM